MLIRILAFLLETVFFVLIAAALLRAWMNWVRVNLRVQPGSFVMALTDWLVKPLRRTLPKALTQSRLDWASVVAAAVLALAYALLWGLLSGLGFSPMALGGLLLFALKMLLRVALQTLLILVLGYAILSWIQPGSPAYGLLARLTEPLLSPLRRVVPMIGGVDLSALALLVLLQIGLMVLG
ncbi:MAG: YggT family protein [Polaromonas sp.]|uniref:YggT family protein n=1 Tax=Polaromonas sp. TaxID=1869339 RepID=UPI00272F6A9C|nr:YggT family protein [Polaromonas sp.]MDP2255865.1 YggT family protein [Polaromonas sp.]MDP3709530.1 YggT family protein [Polaromonas sp.]